MIITITKGQNVDTALVCLAINYFFFNVLSVGIVKCPVWGLGGSGIC